MAINKEIKTRTQITLTKELKKQLDELALKKSLSLNTIIVLALNDFVAKNK